MIFTSGVDTELKRMLPRKGAFSSSASTGHLTSEAKPIGARKCRTPGHVSMQLMRPRDNLMYNVTEGGNLKQSDAWNREAFDGEGVFGKQILKQSA